LRDAHSNLREAHSKPGSYKSIPGYASGAFAGQPVRGDGGYDVATGQTYSINKGQSTGGITSEEEKIHIIKVL
jgi:hypothetical protein